MNLVSIVQFIQSNMLLVGLGVGALFFALDDLKLVYAKVVNGNKSPEEIEQDKAMSAYETLVRYQLKHGHPDTVQALTSLVGEIHCVKHDEDPAPAKGK